MQIARIGSGSAERYSAEVVGAKAANLARMATLGLPVPPAFVLPIELCAAITNREPDGAKKLADGIVEGIEFLENATGRVFGDRRRPLLVSVRSGAARSMPGMLDTVLDVGCTSAAVRGLVHMSGDPGFAHDCRRRFLESYGGVVLGLKQAAFSALLDELLKAEDAASVHMLDSAALEQLAASYQHVIEEEDGALSDDPMDQLKAAVEAVHRSWMSERARTYRKLEHLEFLQGTAVAVQAMVFGNSGAASGAGVAFSRDPSSGATDPVIEVLFESQGEDVVSGRYNPDTEDAIARTLPGVASQLRGALAQLEQEFRDIQDVEFTIEKGKLWFLQTRAAKRTPQAAVRFAVDLVNEKLIAPAEALQRLNGVDLASLTRTRLTDAGMAVAHGTGASIGIAVGRVAFDADSAARLAAGGQPVILVRPDTSTADVAGFAVSAGILAAVGGRTAHAALVARQMGRPCVVGCTELTVDAAHHTARLANATIHEGDWLSMDAGTGSIHLGRAGVVSERPEAELAEIERWRMAVPA